MPFGKQEVLTHSVDGWSFLNEELSHLRLIKLSNLNEEENFYLYDVEEETLLRFTDATIEVAGEKLSSKVSTPWYQNVNQDLLLVVGGLLIISGVAASIYLYKDKKKKKTEF
ncbi:MAG: hypothetical protein GX775_01025 [Erysipelothrix sp.]|nr:hypothetical protein [Erysipelothrix sp.]